MKPTIEQENIILAAKAGKNIAIQAGAGCGKEQPVSCIVKTPFGNMHNL